MSMVEKVAKAICVALGDFPDAELTYEGKPIGPAWKRYNDAARAALEALRVPSDEMVKAWCDEWHEGVGTIYLDELMRRGHAAAITAALGETE